MKVDHKVFLELALLEYLNQEPDIMIICNDDEQISTSKFLLLLHSDTIRDILASVETHKTVSLSLPFSSGSVMNLLSILATGEAVTDNMETLTELNIVAKVLGIKFIGCELKSESQTNKYNLKQKVGKENVSNEEQKDEKEESFDLMKQYHHDEKFDDNDKGIENEPAGVGDFVSINLKTSKRKHGCEPSITDVSLKQKISKENICDDAIKDDKKEPFVEIVDFRNGDGIKNYHIIEIEPAVVGDCVSIKASKRKQESDPSISDVSSKQKVLKENMFDDAIKDARNEPFVKIDNFCNEDNIRNNDDVIEIERVVDGDSLSIKPAKRKQKVEHAVTIVNNKTSKTEYPDNKKQNITEKKQNFLDSLLCNSCGRTFSSPWSLRKHLEKKVCEKRLAHKNKVEQMMKLILSTTPPSTTYT